MVSINEPGHQRKDQREKKMKDRLRILDCTLRDGGYINDWRFGKLTIRSIVTRLDNAGIDIIECGFLDSRVSYDEDRSVYPDMPSVSRTLHQVRLKHAKLYAMIDFGTFDEKLLLPREESALDGIRLIFKKENIDDAMKYAEKIKALGYQLFINPVAFPSYRSPELSELIRKINAVLPEAMSIVDTYGLLLHEDVLDSVERVDRELDPAIELGFHAHNNMGMGSSNDITFINQKIDRNKVVDVSLLGMGKNAGNSQTEVVSAYCNKTNKKSFDLDQILECAYTDIGRFTTQASWGYGLDNFLSAMNDCSPNWVKFLMAKNTLSIHGITTILGKLPYEKREVSFFSKELAEKLYLEYMDRYVNDESATEILRKKIKESSGKVLILCPGATLNTYREKITHFIEENDPFIISVNFVIDRYQADAVFVSNRRRYSQMVGQSAEQAERPELIATSNITPVEELMPEYIVNYRTLYEDIQGDNSMGLATALLRRLGIRKVTVAGMDGYSGRGNEQYYDHEMDLDIHEKSTEFIRRQLDHLKDVEMEWLTPSYLYGKGSENK